MQPGAHRRSLRLQYYDYTQAGGYFVTIVSKDRKPLFGDMRENQIILSSIGEIIRACWYDIPKHFPAVSLGEFVIMPNHLHGIIFINESPHVPVHVVGATHASPLRGKSSYPRGPASGSLAAIIGSFKSSVTRLVHSLPDQRNVDVWQRN